MTTGQIKQAEVDPLTEAPVEGEARPPFPDGYGCAWRLGFWGSVLSFIPASTPAPRAESSLVQATDESSLLTVAWFTQTRAAQPRRK